MRAFAWGLVASSLLVAACHEGAGTPRRLRPAPPASGALADLLPAPAPLVAPVFQPVSRFAFRDAGVSSPATGALGLAGYEEGSELLDDADPGDVWRFGTDEAGLRAVLGDAAVEAGLARLRDAYGPFLGSDALHAELARLLAAHPTLARLGGVTWDLAGLRIGSVTLQDGLWFDGNADGVLESARSALTLRMTLPGFTVATPVDPFPSCAALIGDGSAAAALAAESGRTWVPPAEAVWRWRVTLVAHGALQDLAPAHAALWEATSYPSQGERDAVAHDLGLFAGVLADPAAGLPGSDLVVGVEPDPAFAQGTLQLIAALARTAGDAACLREVDGWLVAPALIQPGLSVAQVAGGAPEGHLLYTYPPAVDAGDGVVDPGLACLHDAAGSPMAIGAEPACATPSGPLELAQGSAPGGWQLVTPYRRLVAVQAGAGASELGPCDSERWSGLCTERFGGGIRLCLGEWAFRNQVGDYWNIHLWQSPGSSAAQSAIKAAAYVLRGLAYVYMGSGDTRVLILLASVSEGSAYIQDLVANLTGSQVAGYSIRGVGFGLTKALVLAWRSCGLLEKDPNLLASFTVDRVIDALAQMAEVEAVGWQDYSNASHCKCKFKFRHPNYCG